MTDLSHAIEQLEWCVRDCMAERHSRWNASNRPRYVAQKVDDIALIRSYIAALRILRREQP